MQEFFHGWRPKVGCVTLAIACVFLTGWVRSLTELDIIVRLNPHTTFVVLSANGTLSWETMWPITTPRPSRWMFRHQADSTNETFDVPLGFLGLGFDFRDQSMIQTMPGSAPSILQSKTWQAPYWSLVIPLTAISVWLLLSKSRQSAAVPADAVA